MMSVSNKTHLHLPQIAIMIVLPKSSIQQVVKDLIHNGGVATLPLPEPLEKILASSFQVASQGLDYAVNVTSYEYTKDPHEDRIQEPSSLFPIIPPNANSANATGYHSAGGDNSLSRYNAHRQGFIFSNGELFHIPNENNFEHHMAQMSHTLSQVIAHQILQGIAEHLDIEQDWFQNVYGPMELSSQWHIKRFVPPLDDMMSRESFFKQDEGGLGEGGDFNDPKQEEDNNRIEWLPVHTDPSLISIVVHDAPGRKEGALGLQYQYTITDSVSGIESYNDNTLTKSALHRTTCKVWKDVGAHGHGVATILGGSLLSYLTGGYIPSAKHRVIYRPDQQSLMKPRQAATLFVRPMGTSILTVPPSKLLEERNIRIRQNCKFEDWLNRVSRNYQGLGASKTGSSKNGMVAKNIKKQSKVQRQKQNISKNEMDPMHWADEYTELTLHGIGGKGLEGREKYLGGELCTLNGHIYTIPGFAHRILDMDTTQDPPAFEFIGPELSGEFKWLRGIPLGDKIYGIPCHSDSVLKIDVLTHNVQLLKWDENAPKACPSNQKWKYHGAAVSDIDGCIYCIPQAAEHVMKINPVTDEISFIGEAYPGVNKWYGGQLLPDGCIYGVCQNHTGILKIDPKTQETSIHGNFSEGGFKWHGAVQHPDGNFYCIPAHADRVLKIEPGNPPKLSLLGENIKTGSHRQDGKYKFLGGAVGGDCVYFFPSDAEYVCEVNTKTGVVRNVGPNLRDHEYMFNNKWQNGFTAVDGTIYGIPLKGQSVLRIRRNETTGEVDVTTIGGPYSGLNKWEGGVTARNGDMYCMPLNHKYSLRIRPINKNAEDKVRNVNS